MKNKVRGRGRSQIRCKRLYGVRVGVPNVSSALTNVNMIHRKEVNTKNGTTISGKHKGRAQNARRHDRKARAVIGRNEV